ncbi:MAG TPA: 4-carboxymuconolactone decarboxylase [Blastocatellia bacterium]
MSQRSQLAESGARPRLPLLPPSALSPEQKELYQNIMNSGVPTLDGAVTQREDGALVGPFNAMLHFPMFGASAWAFNRSLIEQSKLPKPVQQLVVLETTAKFGARYAIYAHEIFATDAGLSAAKIATIVAGERPSDLSRQEAVAYDLAAALNRGTTLPEGTFRAAQEVLGDRGLAEVVFLVGCFSMVSVILNAYDVTVPGRDGL